MWFRRKEEPRNNEPLCFHEWKLQDVRVIWTDNGVESDYYTLNIIGCLKCNCTRKVDDLEYSTMRGHGLITKGEGI